MQSWWANTGNCLTTVKQLSNAGGSFNARDTSVSVRKPLSAIKEENLGHSEKGDYIVIKGLFVYRYIIFL